MNLNEVTKCPHCNFPAIASEFRIIVSMINKCPLCENPMDVSKIVINEDGLTYLKTRKIMSSEEANKENINENVTNINTNANATNKIDD